MRISQLMALKVGALALVVLVLSAVLAPRSARALEWDSEEHNVFLEIPETPFKWSWSQAQGAWAKAGIVRGAERVLKTLKNGDPATGQMAFMQLMVKEVKDKEATLASLADAADTRKKLMYVFGEPAKWPELEIDKEYKDAKDHPGWFFEAKGQATNPRDGKKGLCLARMVVTMARGKIYYLRMYAFMTEYDEEQLELDLTMVADGFHLLNIQEAPKKGEAGATPEEGERPPAPVDPEDDRKEEEIDLREYQLKITKHKSLDVKELDGADDTLILKMEGSIQGGYYSIYLYATKNGQIIDGVQAPNADIQKWMTVSWWKNFSANHPDAELYTYKWPKVKAPTFLTLPEITEENRKHFAGGRKKRPIEVRASDMIKKLKVVEKVKKPKTIGKRYKVIEPYRGIMTGNRPRFGHETIARFAWRTTNHSYRLFVTVGGDIAYTKWGEGIRATLESFRFYKD